MLPKLWFPAFQLPVCIAQQQVRLSVLRRSAFMLTSHFYSRVTQYVNVREINWHLEAGVISKLVQSFEGKTQKIELDIY